MFCEKDMCVIKDVFCQYDDMCQGEGICNTVDGTCFFPNLQKGERED